jgi:hypothetical protein
MAAEEENKYMEYVQRPAQKVWKYAKLAAWPGRGMDRGMDRDAQVEMRFNFK